MAPTAAKPPSSNAGSQIPMKTLKVPTNPVDPLKPPSPMNKPKRSPAPPAEKHKRRIRRPRDCSPTAKFSDGQHPIDIILAYRPLHVSRRKRAQYAKYRRKFENELRAQGLLLEYESKDLSSDGRTAYIKIHAPYETLARQAEMRRIRKPTHKSDLPSMDDKHGKENACSRLSQRLFRDPFKLQDELKYSFPDFFTEPFRRKNQGNFIGSATDTFFTPAERAYLTYDTMKNVQVEVKRRKEFLTQPLSEIGKIAMDPTYRYGAQIREHRPSDVPRFSSMEQKTVDAPGTLKVGIEYLLEMNVYDAAYALHDCALSSDEQYEKMKKKPVSGWPLRMYLYESWVRPVQFFREQPLDAIRDYYGERVAFYFAFLGFYTKMLILPAIVGLLVLIAGGASVGSWDEMSRLACNKTSYIAEETICRDCQFDTCMYKHFRKLCSLAKASEVFDNEATVIFSFFTAIWAVCFLALWTRYRAELVSRWYLYDHDSDNNGTDFGDEPVRPEYEMTAPEKRRNPITGKFEPHFDTRAKMKRYAASVVTIAFFILVVLGFITSLMIYKMMGTYVWSYILHSWDNPYIDYVTLTSVVGAILNGIIIGIMSLIYQRVALYLTKAENHRTDSEYEHSYTYKVVVFEFVNYYGALFYLAFIRGQLLPPPHEQHNYQDRCQVTGCLLDVTIQLAVIYSGKQIIDSFLEIVLPLLVVCFHNVKRRMGKHAEKRVRWEDDYELTPSARILLFTDYLQLFIQYGFVTMFVPAFPLAPLFALLNNIAQIRIDAYKILVYTRRAPPIPVRRETIWTELTRLMTKIAILTNALLIALTMDFVPKIVYAINYSNNTANAMDGYVDWLLSDFNSWNWTNQYDQNLTVWGGNSRDHFNTTVRSCKYRDFRVSPFVPDLHGLKPYDRTKAWWHVLVTRLAFIIVFEHLIFILHSLIEYLIPAEPSRILVRRKREEHLQRERFMEEEKKKEEERKAEEIRADKA